MRIAGMAADVRDVPLAPGALAVFEAFRQAHSAAADALDGRAAAWFSCGPGNVLRLAGVLSILAWAAQPQPAAEPAQLHEGAMRAAICLWQDYLWPHASLVLDASGGSVWQQRLARVKRWLQQR